MIKAIVATDENFGIGFKNSMPWGKFPEDMRHFKTMTIGAGNNSILVGRKTWESINLPHLNDRRTFVLSRDKMKWVDEDQEIYHNNDPYSILSGIYQTHYGYESDDIWIIGGQEIYDLFANFVDEIYITYICKKFDCDKFFTTLDKNPNKWYIIDMQGNEAQFGVNAQKSKAGFCYQFLRAIRI